MSKYLAAVLLMKTARPDTMGVGFFGVVPTKNSIRMSQCAAARYQLLLASSIMRRAGTRDGVRRRGEARQCALYRVNQLFSVSDIVWLARDVFAPRDSK